MEWVVEMQEPLPAAVNNALLVVLSGCAVTRCLAFGGVVHCDNAQSAQPRGSGNYYKRPDEA